MGASALGLPDGTTLGGISGAGGTGMARGPAGALRVALGPVANGWVYGIRLGSPFDIGLDAGAPMTSASGEATGASKDHYEDMFVWFRTLMRDTFA